MDATSLACLLENKQQQKFDEYVHSDLLDQGNVIDRLDLASARKSAALELLRSRPVCIEAPARRRRRPSAALACVRREK